MISGIVGIGALYVLLMLVLCLAVGVTYVLVWLIAALLGEVSFSKRSKGNG